MRGASLVNLALTHYRRLLLYLPRTLFALLEFTRTFCAFDFLLLIISMMDLNDRKLMLSLGEVLRTKNHLQYLDLSWSNLGPEALSTISSELLTIAHQLRDINLSYNHVNHNSSTDEETPHTV